MLDRQYSLSGNCLLHSLTASRHYSLRIDLEDFQGRTKFALYEQFAVNSSEDGFRLTLGGYSGTAGMPVQLLKLTVKNRLKMGRYAGVFFCLFVFVFLRV